MSPPVIGIDLDNTIIDYSKVFGLAAEAINLLPAQSGLVSKAAIKAQLLESYGDEAWMRLQGQVYGRFISQAQPYPGCETFISAVKEKGATVVIVSHKTQYGHFDLDRVDLRQAALGWLKDEGFVADTDALINRSDIHFETTRDAKIARIAALGCDVFIDDLPEVLNHRDFPTGVERLWFAPGPRYQDGKEHTAPFSWPELMDKVLPML